MENTNTNTTNNTATLTGAEIIAQVTAAIMAIWRGLYTNDDGWCVECNPKWVRAERLELANKLEEALFTLDRAWKDAPYSGEWDNWELPRMMNGALLLACAVRFDGTPAEMRRIIRDMY
jgi:hypothetical protein